MSLLWIKKGVLLMENNIDTMIVNSKTVSREHYSDKVKDILNQLEKVILNSKDLLLEANQIDVNNQNGISLDFDVFEKIFQRVKEEELFYGKVSLSIKDDEKKILYGKEIFDIGTVVVIDDGDSYVFLEMVLKNLLAGNATIFCNSGYSYGVNQLLLQFIQNVLEQFHFSKNFIQIYLSEEYDDVYQNFANIDLIVCIGDHNLQRSVLEKSKNPVLVSGYNHFDLYIEDKTHLSFLEEILKTSLPIQVYVNESLDLDLPDAIYVSDIDEAIGQIEYNGNGYSTSIFTENPEHASKFIKEVSSTYVTVNTSPTIERILDISLKDLVREKTIIYPTNISIKKIERMIL